jgi:3-oxo-5alpha-steroid 4-dehydrogenase
MNPSHPQWASQVEAPLMVGDPDRFQWSDTVDKIPSEMSAIDDGPFHAIDVSVHSTLFPLPMLTLGALQLEEKTGLLKKESGEIIPGLYAAGCTAVGICSNVHMSGLSAGWGR